MQDWLTDPRLAAARDFSDPNAAWLAAQRLRDDYGWQDPELGSLEHEAYMRRAFDKYPASTALVGLPQAFAYPAIKWMAQAPWSQPLLHLGAQGVLAASQGLKQASPASWDQFGAGISGYVGGLLDWVEKE